PRVAGAASQQDEAGPGLAGARHHPTRHRLPVGGARVVAVALLRGDPAGPGEGGSLPPRTRLPVRVPQGRECGSPRPGADAGRGPGRGHAATGAAVAVRWAAALRVALAGQRHHLHVPPGLSVAGAGASAVKILAVDAEYGWRGAECPAAFVPVVFCAV